MAVKRDSSVPRSACAPAPPAGYRDNVSKKHTCQSGKAMAGVGIGEVGVDREANTTLTIVLVPCDEFTE